MKISKEFVALQNELVRLFELSPGLRRRSELVAEVLLVQAGPPSDLYTVASLLADRAGQVSDRRHGRPRKFSTQWESKEG